MGPPNTVFRSPDTHFLGSVLLRSIFSRGEGGSFFLYFPTEICIPEPTPMLFLLLHPPPLYIFMVHFGQHPANTGAYAKN